LGWLWKKILAKISAFLNYIFGKNDMFFEMGEEMMGGGVWKGVFDD
jgi:hypothetical protein